MPTYKQKMIGVEESTYNRLNALKKGYSFNEYISEMITYFERNNINPFHVQSLPSELLSKEHDRIIKILKAQEKFYKDQLAKMTATLNQLYEIFRSVRDIKDTPVSASLLENDNLTFENIVDMAEMLNTTSKSFVQDEENLREREAEISRIFSALEIVKEEGTVVKIGEDTFAYKLPVIFETQLVEVNKKLSSSVYREIAFKGIVNEMTGQEYEKIPFPKDDKEECILVFKGVLDGVYQNLTNYVQQNK